MSDRKPSPILPIAVTLAVLLGLYVGAYYLLVKPITWTLYDLSGDYNRREVLPHYSDDLTERIWCRPLFAPIHQFDRRLRPHVWEP